MNLETKEFQSIADMPIARMMFDIVAHGDSLYAIGIYQ
jgi:hypothetical protein